MKGAGPRGVRPENPRDPDAQQHLDQLGRRIRSLRKARGRSQEQLAHEAGVHRAVIGFIERGEREIGVTLLWPLAAALGVSVGELFVDQAVD